MKIKQLKIINQDESTEIADIGANAENVDYNDTNVKLKLDELSNNVDTNTTNISNEMITRANAVTNLQSQINGLASGSPKGSYANAAAIVTANPDTGVYIAQDNGHIYSWTKNDSNVIDLGVYQGSTVDESNKTIQNVFSDLLSYHNGVFTGKIQLTFDAIVGGIINDTTGKFGTNSDTNLIASDKYLYVPKGCTLTCQSHNGVLTNLYYYDDNLSFVRAQRANGSLSADTITITNNDFSYVRLGT